MSERQKSGHGGRRQGAGRPLGSKNRLPRGKKFDQFKEIVYDAEASEYLSTNENKLFDGSAIQLMQAIYQCERLPVKTRLYAAAKACEYEPKPEMKVGEKGAILILPNNWRDEKDESYREEYDKWLDSVILCCAREVACRLLGQKSRWGSPASIIEAVEKALAAYVKEDEETVVIIRKRNPVEIDGSEDGLAVERPGNVKETADERRSNPPSEQSAVRPAGQNHAMMDNLREQAGTTASYPSEAQAPAKPPEALPLPFGEPQHQLATVILHARPHQCFQALSGNRYSADERGEIRCNDRDDIESLLRSGCKAPAS
jgi:hypothetical protein